LFVVKTAAAATGAWSSVTTSARSGAPVGLMPALVPAALNRRVR
jgi:hypothetical protein